MSSLQRSLEEYLATRRAAGFALRDTETALNGFVGFAEEVGHRGFSVLVEGGPQRPPPAPDVQHEGDALLLERAPHDVVVGMRG